MALNAIRDSWTHIIVGKATILDKRVEDEGVAPPTIFQAIVQMRSDGDVQTLQQQIQPFSWQLADASAKYFSADCRIGKSGYRTCTACSTGHSLRCQAYSAAISWRVCDIGM